jgi:hypothetical protein
MRQVRAMTENSLSLRMTASTALKTAAFPMQNRGFPTMP